MTQPVANAEQHEYWNDIAGPKWVAMQTVLDAQIHDMGLAMLEGAALTPGEHVVDVGCGCGAISREAARRVAPEGQVLGVDLSGPLLDRARALASGEGIGNVRFIQADAQTYAFDRERYDVVVSRFGVMFFEDPVAAFRNLAHALKPAGRVAFVCWRPLQENPWMTVPLMAAAEHIELPPAPAPGEPGPFSFGEEFRIRGILDRGGFASIAIEPHDVSMTLGGGLPLHDAIEFFFRIGPLSRPLSEAGPEEQEAVRAALVAALGPKQTATGIEMPGAAWIVTARKRS